MSLSRHLKILSRIDDNRYEGSGKHALEMWIKASEHYVPS